MGVAFWIMISMGGIKTVNFKKKEKNMDMNQN